MPAVRVLQLVTRMNIGGPARHVLHLATQLDDGFKVRVAAGRPPAGEGVLTDDSVPVVPVGLVRAVDPRRDARAIRQVRSLLRAGSVDILHTHMAKAGSVGRLAATSMRRRPATVHTFHGHVLEGYFNSRVERGFLAAERALARRTDALVAVSTEIRDTLHDLGIGHGDQWHVVRPASDLAPFFAVRTGDPTLRSRFDIPAGRVLFAVLGRLAPIKDHATAIRAVAGTDDVHLAICGEGELEPTLRRLATDLGVADRVHFTGWVQDVPSLLTGVDGVLLTSRNEGTPLALVEAHAAGLPVVATAVGGVADVVEHRRTGILVPPGDVAAGARALRELAADPELRREYGAAGRTRIRERYDPQVAVEAVAALYRDLIGRAMIRRP